MKQYQDGKSNAVTMVVIAVLITVVLAGLAWAAAVTPGRVTGYAAGNTLWITMPYTGGDANNTTNAYVDYALCTGGANTRQTSAYSASPIQVMLGAANTLNANTCYQVRAAYNTPLGATNQLIKLSTTFDNTLLHNTNRFSANGADNKWGGAGWGITGTQYGPITCDTCHTKATTNIKRVKTTISATNNAFPGGATNFKSVTTPDGFGDDSIANRTTSTKVCEGCHTQNKYHNYNSAGNNGGAAANLHNNNADCTTCHPHNLGFYYAASCTTCHGNPPVSASYGGGTAGYSTPATGATNSGAGNSLNVGAHNAHSGTGGRNMGCNTCHTGYNMPGTTVDLGFVVNSGNWPSWGGSTNTVTTGSYNAPNSTVLTNGYSFTSTNAGTTVNTATASFENTCSVYCHGNWSGSGGNIAQPSWIGSNQAACGTCHGTTSANAPAANSHPKHAGSATYNIACTRCHPTVTDNSHVRGTVAWSFGDTNNTYNGTASGNTSRIAQGGSYFTCATIYCHSNANPIGGVNLATTSSPVWGGSAACSSCHRVNDTLANMQAAGTPGRMSPVHEKHLAIDRYNFLCDQCHANTAATNSNSALNGPSAYGIHVNGVKDVKFEGHALGSANINNAGGNYTSAGAGNYSCNSTYCHSRGTSTVAPFAAPLNPVLSWNGNTSTCSSCHGANDTVANVTTNGTPAGAHNKHIANDRHNFTCDACHYDTVADGSSTAIRANGGYNVQHVNGAVNWKFTNAYPFGGANINMSGGNHTAGGSCDSTYCHSKGKSTVSPFTPPMQAAPSWSGGATNCYSCHGNADEPANVNAAFNVNASAYNGGKHVIHAATNTIAALNKPSYAITCDNCHAETMQNDSSSNIISFTAHANGAINVKFSTTLRFTSLDQSGGSANANGAINAASSVTCTNIYCHSQGTRRYPGASNGAFNYAKTNVAPITAPVWTGPIIQCNGCHGDPGSSLGAPNYVNDPTGMTAKANSHYKHVYTNGFGCAECHAATTNGGANILPPGGSAVHVNGGTNIVGSRGGVNIAYSSGAVNANSASAAFGAPYGGTCSTSYCHTNGAGANASPSPQWGQVSTGCNFCHGNPPATGAHAKHVKTGVTTAYGTTRISTNNGNDLDCGYCHPTTIGNHMDGKVDISLMPTDAPTTIKGRNNAASLNAGTIRTPGTNVVCSGAYCHSNGSASNTYVNSPNWYGASPSDTCAECHGNWPNTGAHNAHLVGIHYDNIYNGAANVAGAGNTLSASHGGANSNTTINCNMCHNETVTVSYNDKGTSDSGRATCSTANCHATTNLKGAMNSATITLAGTNAHLNGAVNMKFAAVNMLTRAQIRDDITTVAELNSNWTRAATNYKTLGSNPYDVAKAQLSTAASYNGTNCSTVPCHNGNATPAWKTGTGSTCTICHTVLP